MKNSIDVQIIKPENKDIKENFTEKKDKYKEKRYDKKPHKSYFYMEAIIPRNTIHK